MNTAKATTCKFPLHDKFTAMNIPCDCQLPTATIEDSTSHITDSQWVEFASEEKAIGRSEARGS